MKGELLKTFFDLKFALLTTVSASELCYTSELWQFLQFCFNIMLREFLAFDHKSLNSFFVLVLPLDCSAYYLLLALAFCLKRDFVGKWKSLTYAFAPKHTIEKEMKLNLLFNSAPTII